MQIDRPRPQIISEEQERKIDGGKLLGRGSFGDVYAVQHNGVLCAVKKINMHALKNKRDSQQRQIKLLREINHPNIIRFIQQKQDKKGKYKYIYQELGDQDLKSFLIKNKDKLKQDKTICLRLCLQIISAVSYLRAQHIANRDLKIDNIVIKQEEGQKFFAKLIDFGQARKFILADTGSILTGTFAYMSPEVRSENYGLDCDLWSLCVIIYQIYNGFDPNVKFPAESKGQDLFWPFKQNLVRQQVQIRKYYERDIFQPLSLPKSIPKPFRVILRGVLKINPKSRLTFKQITDILTQNKAQLLQQLSQQQKKYFQQEFKKWNDNQQGIKQFRQNLTNKMKIFKDLHLGVFFRLHNAIKSISNIAHIPISRLLNENVILSTLIFICHLYQKINQIIQQLRTTYNCLEDDIECVVKQKDWQKTTSDFNLYMNELKAFSFTFKSIPIQPKKIKQFIHNHCNEYAGSMIRILRQNYEEFRTNT